MTRWQSGLRFVVSLLLLTVCLLLSLVLTTHALDQPLAPPDRSSPQATLHSFIDNVNEGFAIVDGAYQDYLAEPGLLPSATVRAQAEPGLIIFDRATACLDTSEVPSRLERDVAISGTILLKEILDRIPLPPDSQIPDVEAVEHEPDLVRWTIPNTEIHLVKITDGPLAGEFLFSAATVARLKEFYEKVKTLPYRASETEGFYDLYIANPGQILSSKWIQRLPPLLKRLYGGQALWQWLSMVMVLLLAVWLPYQVLQWSWRRMATVEPPQRTWETLIPAGVAIVNLIVVNYIIDAWINITGNMLFLSLIVLETTLWTVVAITLFLLGNAVAETLISSPNINPQGLDASMIRTVARLLSSGVGTVILVLGIERVGISLVPVLAGLGIGGLALALAARPTLENVIAGLILLVDRPVSVGERCYFGGQEGTIEEIGLRSTRIRALDGDLISLPNSKFSELQLTNRTRRDRILLHQALGLRYETTSEQLHQVLTQLRELIVTHPRLLELKGSDREARVRFVKYGDYSLDIEIFVYVDTGLLSEFLRIQEEILLIIKEIVAAAGTDFAFPSQTMYLAQDSGVGQMFEGES
ncbi:MAG: mechanosensitive ion channel family protein [Spirulina sp. SIO3F2]|nr:mechanosensitive ion channel family protein [Spirulina sp. SIO3F2]